MLCHQEINEEVDPLTQCRERRTTLRQQDRTSLGASLNLVAVHGNNEIRPRREMAVNSSYPDICGRSDVAHWCLDPGGDEHRGGGGKQRLLFPPRVGSKPSVCLPCSLFDGRHRFIPFLKLFLDKRNLVPYTEIGTEFHFVSIPYANKLKGS